MSAPRQQIWADDKLARQAEADVLQDFLLGEVERRTKLGREQAFVLAIDAAYGEGKSWFLERLRQQLELDHPVAFLDAWADEANDEPLTAFMSAIETALEPYTRPGTTAREKLALAKRAALPAMARVVTGAIGKAGQRYLGDSIGEDLSELFGGDAESPTGDAGDVEAIAAGFEAGMAVVTKEIASVVDRQGAAALAAYRRQLKSRKAFTKNMADLVAAIKGSITDKQPPLFVIVDELDRCRPDYAIRVLEEVKHFFGVPNVAFIIALHGEQLAESVNAVYGAGFNSRAYLRRFFDRTYKLRRLSLSELIRTHIDSCSFNEAAFNFPPLSNGSVAGQQVDVSTFTARFLGEMDVTPREAQSVIDGLNVFVSRWKLKIPIEIPYILGLLVSLIRGQDLAETLRQTTNKTKFLLPASNFFTKSQNVGAQSLLNAYATLRKKAFTSIYNVNWGSSEQAYVASRLDHEFSVLHGRKAKNGLPATSVMRNYSRALHEIRGLIGEEVDDDEVDKVNG